MTAPNVVARLEAVGYDTQETPAQHAEAITGLCLALTSDAESLGLYPVDVNLHRSMGVASAALMFGGSDTAAVDALATAYGLAPADSDGGLYGRRGKVTVDGQRGVLVLLYCARPAVLALEAPTTSPALPVARPVRVAAERVDESEVSS